MLFVHAREEDQTVFLRDAPAVEVSPKLALEPAGGASVDVDDLANVWIEGAGDPEAPMGGKERRVVDDDVNRARG